MKLFVHRGSKVYGVADLALDNRWLYMGAEAKKDGKSVAMARTLIESELKKEGDPTSSAARQAAEWFWSGYERTSMSKDADMEDGSGDLEEMVNRAMVEVRYAMNERRMNLEQAIAYAKERSTAGPKVWEIVRQRGGRDAKDAYENVSYRGFTISDSPGTGFIISKSGHRYGSKPTLQEAKKEVDAYVAQGLGTDGSGAKDAGGNDLIGKRIRFKVPGTNGPMTVVGTVKEGVRPNELEVKAVQGGYYKLASIGQYEVLDGGPDSGPAAGGVRG